MGQPIAIALMDYSINHYGRTGADAYFISIGLCGKLGILYACLLYGAKYGYKGAGRFSKRLKERKVTDCAS